MKEKHHRGPIPSQSLHLNVYSSKNAIFKEKCLTNHQNNSNLVFVVSTKVRNKFLSL